VKRKKTQNPQLNTLKSHCHTIEIFPQQRKQKKRQKYKLLFCWDKQQLYFYLFSLSLSQGLSFSSVTRRSTSVFSFVAHQTKKQKGYVFLFSSCGSRRKNGTPLSPPKSIYM
jgi:hypothetical protein